MYRTAYLLLLLTTIFWAGNAVAAKFAVGHVSPMVLNTSRWGIALVILSALGWRRFAADWPEVRRRALYLLLLGAAGFSLFNVALYSAVLYTSAINASIEQAGIPMLIIIANFLLFGQRASMAQIVGFLVSFVGVAITASHGDPRRLLALDLNFGDLLMLGAITAYAGYTVALRFRPQIHWQSLMIALAAGGFLASLPFTTVEIASQNAIMPDSRGLAVIAYAAIFPSMLAQMFYIRGIEFIGGNRAGLFVNLVPVFGTLMSVFLLGEDLHLYHGVALALVLGGIWLAERSSRRKAAA
ncbi:DMT family transporter [Mesorhizobium marinum]|uniref:DMT family transporter n=1 Tax=Mesorhizobium marinum TaxID=3228790 RepID=UPI003467D1C4